MYTSKNFYLRLISLIDEGNNQKQISSILGWTKQRVKYHFSRLQTYKVITKVSNGVWEVNTLKIEDFFKTNFGKKIGGCGSSSFIKCTPKHFLPEYTPICNIRAHSFVFKIKISIPRWKEREQYLRHKHILYRNIKQGQAIDIKGNIVWLCNNSIVVYFKEDKSFYTRSAEEGYLHAIKELNAIIVNLENKLNVSLRHSKGYKVSVSRQHYAKIKDLIASKCNELNKKIEIRDKIGELWLLVDNSLKLNELEAVKNKTSVNDMDNVVKPQLERMFNDWRDFPDKIMSPIEITNSISQIVQYNKAYMENINTHITAIKELAKHSKEQTKIIKQLKKILGNKIKC